MELKAQLMFGTVMHGRLFPKKNNFTYKIYYLALPLSSFKKSGIAYNKFGLLSFYDKDHGNRDGSGLDSWARGILSDYGINDADGEIILVCMPRVMGYVFNPVSFWLCHDKNGALRAVLCEVHNTFGERHTYLCAKADKKTISHEDILEAEKLFHVSPLLERQGHYKFRFDLREDNFAIWIDYYNEDNKKQLITSLIGDMKPMNKKQLRGAFFKHPLITLKAIILIHWQALKLLLKGIKYVSRPMQKSERVSASKNLTKM